MNKDFDFKNYTWRDCTEEAIYFILPDYYDEFVSELNISCQCSVQENGIRGFIKFANEHSSYHRNFIDTFFENNADSFHDYLLEQDQEKLIIQANS